MSSPAAPPPPPEMSIYRRHTINLLHRYFNMSIELGRLPNILGREFFRSHVTGHAAWFEDTVVFVHDVERCLQALHPLDQLLIARCVLQEYGFDETARLLRCNEKTVRRRFPEAVDQMTVLLLDRKLLVLERPRRAATVEASPPVRASSDEAPVPSDEAPASTGQPGEHPAPEPGIIPDLSACGNLFVKPLAEAISL